MSYELKTDETLGLVSLEPRILLDAAGFVTGAEVAMDAMIAEGAELGVQAIFEGEETSATPRGGPWLDELTLTESSELDGEELSSTPRGGPWLDEISVGEGSTSGDDVLSATPRGGPWL